MTTKKKLIKTIGEFNILKKMVTRDAFYEKFELSMELVAKITAEEALTKLYFEDSREMTSAEKKQLLSGKF